MFYFCRLIPPRPSFAYDMTDEEMQLMGDHGRYWSSHVADGRAVVFGAVLESAASWGVVIVRVDDEEAARALTAADPAIAADRGFSYDVLSMPNAIAA
jgi:hypothetical protein